MTSEAFPCPACNQIINDSADKCRYCSTPVDREAALAGAEIQDRVNLACSDASYLRTAAITMFIFLGLSLVPFIPLVYWGFLFTFITLAVLLIRWQLMYRKIPTQDSDYHKAIKNRDLALILWLVAIAAGFVIRPLVEILLLHGL